MPISKSPQSSRVPEVNISTLVPSKELTSSGDDSYSTLSTSESMLLSSSGKESTPHYAKSSPIALNNNNNSTSSHVHSLLNELPSFLRLDGMNGSEVRAYLSSFVSNFDRSLSPGAENLYGNTTLEGGKIRRVVLPFSIPFFGDVVCVGTHWLYPSLLAIILFIFPLFTSIGCHSLLNPVMHVIIWFCWLLAFFFALRCTLKDPGVVPRRTDVSPVSLGDFYLPKEYLSSPITDVNLGSIPFMIEDEFGRKLMHIRYCQVCKVYISPRNLHCWVCEQCVDIGDHHCHLLGVCIGRKNYWDFWWALHFAHLLSFLVFISVTACSVHHAVSEEISIGEMLRHMYYLPIVIYVIQMVGGISITGLLFFHWFLLLTNSTTVEHLKGTWLGSNENPWRKTYAKNFFARLLGWTSKWERAEDYRCLVVNQLVDYYRKNLPAPLESASQVIIHSPQSSDSANSKFMSYSADSQVAPTISPPSAHPVMNSPVSSVIAGQAIPLVDSSVSHPSASINSFGVLQSTIPSGPIKEKEHQITSSHSINLNSAPPPLDDKRINEKSNMNSTTIMSKHTDPHSQALTPQTPVAKSNSTSSFDNAARKNMDSSSSREYSPSSTHSDNSSKFFPTRQPKKFTPSNSSNFPNQASLIRENERLAAISGFRPFMHQENEDTLPPLKESNNELFSYTYHNEEIRERKLGPMPTVETDFA